jgi:hypothetical protein
MLATAAPGGDPVTLTGYLRRTLAPVPQPEVPVHLTARELPMPRHPDVLVFGDWHPPGNGSSAGIAADD